MGHLVPLHDLSLESFDRLARGGVPADTRDAVSFLAAYRTEAERKTLLEEIEHIQRGYEDIVEKFVGLGADMYLRVDPQDSSNAKIG